MSKIDFKHRRVVGGPSFEPHRKITGCASHEPDLRSEAMKRAIWDRKSLTPEVLADRCHESNGAVMYASAMPDQNGASPQPLPDPFERLKATILKWPRNY